MFDQPPTMPRPGQGGSVPAQNPAGPAPVRPSPMAPKSATPEDIFARVNTGAGVPTRPAMPPVMPRKRGGRKIGIIILLVIIVILLIAGGALAYLSMVKQPILPFNLPFLPKVNQNLNLNLNANANLNVNAPMNVNLNENVNAPVNANLNENANINVPPALDSDSDGLTDDQEKALGTNPYNVDTDNDGLFDKEEIDNYHTNPLNPDTDGDGYLDGEEVKSGYNPNGPGKLEPFGTATPLPEGELNVNLAPTPQ